MSYTAWSVVAFEQPTAAKWNQLGDNDAFFNTEIIDIKDKDSCHIVKNAAGSHQTIPNNTTTAITFDSEVTDTNNMHDNSTQNSRITIKQAGKYILIGSIRWESVSSGGYNRTAAIYRNGSELATDNMQPSSGTAAPTQNIAAIKDLSVNDYIELKVTQDSGGNLDISKWNSVTFLQLSQILA